MDSERCIFNITASISELLFLDLRTGNLCQSALRCRPIHLELPIPYCRNPR